VNQPDRIARRWISAAIVVVCATLTAAAPAQAFNFWELEVYPYQTEGAGFVELEWLQNYVPKGHSHAEEGFATDKIYRSSLELTYGLTDRLEAAVYLDLAHPDGHSTEYAGSRYRLRGSLFEPGEMPLDLGWYAELEWRRTPEFGDSQLEIDLRPIIERDFGRFALMLNPIFDKAIFVGPNKNKGFEFNYASKISYRWTPMFQPGIEFYGDIGRINDTDPLDAQQHYIFPVIDMILPGGVNANFGAGFGLTRGSDQVITKLNIELERFIGTLF
jgi:hypothetical protein